QSGCSTASSSGCSHVALMLLRSAVYRAVVWFPHRCGRRAPFGWFDNRDTDGRVRIAQVVLCATPGGRTRARRPLGRRMPKEPPENAPDERGEVEIGEAIIDDTRDLVVAHVEALRDDMTSRLSSLGAALTSSLLAFSIMIVTALLAGIALAMTLIAIGLPA